MEGFDVDVRACVEKRHPAVQGGHEGHHCRSLHAREPPEDEDRSCQQRPGVSRGHGCVCFATLHQVENHPDRGVLLLADCVSRVLAHLHHLGGVTNRDPLLVGSAEADQLSSDSGLVSDQNHVGAKFTASLHRSLDHH